MSDEIRHLRKQARELTKIAESCLASARTGLDGAEARPGGLAKAVDSYVALADEVRRCIRLAHKFEREALRLERAEAVRAAARPKPPRERDGQPLH